MYVIYLLLLFVLLNGGWLTVGWGSAGFLAAPVPSFLTLGWLFKGSRLVEWLLIPLAC